MYQALYRQYRPEVFEDVLGQESIVRILRNQIDKEEVGHAYLLCGTRGTGKTTVARLLAKAVNCTSGGSRPCGTCENCRAISEGTFLDVVEIDAASNNSVDNIRDLREAVNYPPVAGRKKVYIIDEAHMLTQAACNALLKTLEEPPEYCVFILATTDPQKLPATILSRCMRLDFKRVTEKDIKAKLRSICSDRGVTAEETALDLVAANGDGSVRDSLSLLDQCLAGVDTELSRDDVSDMLGIPSSDMLRELTDTVAGGDVEDVIMKIDEIISDGKDVRQLTREWMGYYRDLLITKYVSGPERIMNMSTENAEKLREQAESLETGYITGAIRQLSATVNEMRDSSQSRILLEMAALNIGNAGSLPKPAAKKKTVLSKKGDLWQRITERAGSGENIPALAMLAGGVEIVSVEGDKIKVRCNSTKTTLIENNLDVLNRAASEVLGRDAEILTESTEEKKERSMTGDELARQLLGGNDG